jgi:hypothetical protein
LVTSTLVNPPPLVTWSTNGKFLFFDLVCDGIREWSWRMMAVLFVLLEERGMHCWIRFYDGSVVATPLGVWAWATTFWRLMSQQGLCPFPIYSLFKRIAELFSKAIRMHVLSDWATFRTTFLEPLSPPKKFFTSKP